MSEQSSNPLEARVRSMHDSGLGTAEIAGRLGRSEHHVRRILAWSAIERERTPRRHPAAIEARVAELRRTGETAEAIGRRFGRSSTFADRIDRLSRFRTTRSR